MFRNHIKTTLRSLKRNLGYSIINIFGLGVGIAASFVILMFVQQELSYEKHFGAHEQTYRIGTKFMSMGRFAKASEQLHHIVNTELPYIKESTRADRTGDITLAIPGFEIPQSGLYVDSAFFKVFDYNFTDGNRDQIFNSPNSIVITQDLSRSLFGMDKAIGRTIKLTDHGAEKLSTILTVTGVINSSNVRSHVNANFWALSNLKKKDQSSGFDSNWFSISSYNYVKVREGIDKTTFQSDLDSIVARHVYPMMESNLNFKEWSNKADSFLFIAQPISDIYLKSSLNFDLVAGGDETTVYVLLAVALLIIVVASVNFINLTTAKAVNRGKEIGVKKSLGGSRSALVVQLLVESITISLIAMIFAMGFSELFLLAFEYVAGQSLLVEVFTSYTQLVWLLFLSLLIGFFAGIYPALYLSGFKTSKALKGGFETALDKSSFRNVLVVFQFFLSISLICLAWIVQNQLDYLKDKDLGFDQEHVLIIDNANKLEDSAKTFKELLSQRAEVSSCTFFRRMPGSTTSFSMTSLSLGGAQEPLNISRFRGDQDFIKTMGFDLIEGRNFSEYNKTEKTKVILNEAAVKALMLDDPIGTKFTNDDMEVIGVVRDFNFESLRNGIAPAIIQITEDGNIAFKLKNSKAMDFIQFAEAKWNEMSPEEPMEYHFLDQNFDAMITKERMLAKSMTIFTFLSILISCLGLYGLSSYMALQRKKEIGIRKVLGASVFKMWMMLSKQFTKLIIIATIIAIPVTLWIAQSWLDGFAYRIELSMGVFIFSGIGVLLITLCTVGYESIKAALSNPVDSLQDE